MLIGSWQRLAIHNETINLSVHGVSLKRVSEGLGQLIDENLNGKGHVANIIKKVTTSLRIMKKTKPVLNQRLLINIYQSVVELYFNYCSTVWDSIDQTQSDKLQKLQIRAAGIVTSVPYTALS